MNQIIEPIAPHYREVWGARTVKLAHHLAGHELFSDDSLAALLDVVDPQFLGLKTMGEHCPDPLAWYRCSREGVSGRDVLAAARHGRLWINISAVHDAEPRLASILNQLYDELEMQLPDFRAFKRRLGLLISSPSAHVVYHADPLGQGLVQLRGRKRIWIYPAAAPFLQPGDIENMVRGKSDEDLGYQPWFDEYAEVHDLGPGEMLYWALNSPHRVANEDCLNVSLTTEHWTRQVRRSYVKNYGNGILRAHGVRPRSDALSGPAFWTKAGLTVIERARRGSSAAQLPPVSFRVDPNSDSGTSPMTGVPSR